MATFENGFPIGAHHWLPDMAEESEDGVKPELPVWQFVLKGEEKGEPGYVWEVRTWFRRCALEEFQRNDTIQILTYPDPLKLRDVQFKDWEQAGNGSSYHDRVFLGDVVQIQPSWAF